MHGEAFPGLFDKVGIPHPLLAVLVSCRQSFWQVAILVQRRPGHAAPVGDCPSSQDWRILQGILDRPMT